MVTSKDTLIERTGYSRFWHLRYLEALLFGPLIGVLIAAMGMIIEYIKGNVDSFIFLLSTGLVVFLGLLTYKIYINDFLKHHKEVLQRLYSDELAEKDIEFLAEPLFNPKIAVIFCYSVLFWLALTVFTWIFS